MITNMSAINRELQPPAVPGKVHRTVCVDACLVMYTDACDGTCFGMPNMYIDMCIDMCIESWHRGGVAQRTAAVMAYIVIAYIVMACIVMAYIVMAHTVMACTVMAAPRRYGTKCGSSYG